MRWIVLISGWFGWWCPCLAQDGYVPGAPSLAYWKLGSRKECVIAVHGGPAVMHTYLRPELDGLAKTATLIYYDQRGVGKSDEAATYNWQAHVADLHRLIRTVSPKRRVFLVGSSWGSALALLYAYTYPEDLKGIILSGTVRWEGRGLDSAAYQTYKAEHYPHPVPLRIVPIPLNEHQVVASADKDSTGNRMVRPIQKTATYYAGPPSAETRTSWVTAPPVDSLRRITLPVLIFNGDAKDCLVDAARRYMAILPQAELCTIPAACHDPWFSDPAAFTNRCGQFIRQIRRSR